MKFIIAFALIFLPFLSFSQSVVSYHQSPNGGQAAYAYEFNERFRPEIRLYPNTAIEDLIVKLMFNYDWIEEENYEFYSGISLLGSTLGGPTFGLPIGLNFYPFENKKFGFLMEFSPNFPFDEGGVAYFAGSWGIRYRFNKGE
ncbi:hypothetical protein [Marivirga sp.]|uniref:hypothetical protein n=1 Tax=Marivirga sp. TaxID=2018662 RepID=UPI0025FAE1FD|nr:hypothetical protein [Marivirga sp.]